MTENFKNIFDLYSAEVDRLCGVTKARAIELSETPSKGTISQVAIEKLFESLSCDGWKVTTGTNWAWRTDEGKPAAKNASKEVLLERAVAGQDLQKWTYQMSTSSGVQIIQGKIRRVNLFSRKSIDLVRFIKPRHYAFVELKVGSNNPLYAAFEVLGYALAYLHARSNRRAGTGKHVGHDVFDAESIELTILGPRNWYAFGKELECNLDWLADEIATSLSGFVKSTLKDKLIFTMKFRQFAADDQISVDAIEQLAKEVHRLAEVEWWRC